MREAADLSVGEIRAFDVDTFLDQLEASVALKEFSSDSVDFDDADPLGTLYAMLYPRLKHAGKLRCFERLCRTAIRLH